IGVVCGARRPADAGDEHATGSGAQRHRPQAVLDEGIPSCERESSGVSDWPGASVQPDSLSTASQERGAVWGGSRRRTSTDIVLDAQAANPALGRLSLCIRASVPLNSVECGPVRTREQEVVDGCQTGPFPGMVQASQLVVT